MLLEFYILFQILLLVFLAVAFFSKQELFWAISFVLSGFLMLTSFYIEKTVYIYNSTISAYTVTTVNYSYPYLMGINLIFASLSLLYGFYDLFENNKDFAEPPKRKDDDRLR